MGNGLNLISAEGERRREDGGRDGCVDREDWRAEFKIWSDVMSGDRGGESREVERDRGGQRNGRAEHK